MASPSSTVHQGMRSRILTMVWTSLALALMVVGLGFWTFSQLSSLRDHESKLHQGQLFLANFTYQAKVLGLATSKTLFLSDQNLPIADRLTESVKHYQDFERYYLNQKQKLLEIGSELGKLEDTKQCTQLIDGMLVSIRNALQSLSDRNSLDPSMTSLAEDWGKSQQVTDQLLRGLLTQTTQLSDATTELLQRKSVALAYFNLAAVVLFLVTLLVLGITIANNIHRDTILSSEKVTQTFASMGHTLSDLNQAGHTLGAATSSHDGKISETLASLQGCQMQLSRIREDSLLSERYSQETCQSLDEGTAAIGRASHAVSVARETKSVLQQLFEVLDTTQKKMVALQHTASKTQMLSYNASIEAARAGDHGRGFAVVALELSHIADLGTKATDDMASTLEESANSVTKAIHDFSTVVDHLADSSALASEHVEKMAYAARSANQKLSAVKNDLMDHSKKLDGCFEAMTAVQSTAKSKEDMVRGLAGLSDILHHQAQELNATFDHIRTIIQGPERLAGATKEPNKTTTASGMTELPPPSPLGANNASELRSPPEDSPSLSGPSQDAGIPSILEVKVRADQKEATTDPTRRKSA